MNRTPNPARTKQIVLVLLVLLVMQGVFLLIFAPSRSEPPASSPPVESAATGPDTLAPSAPEPAPTVPAPPTEEPAPFVYDPTGKRDPFRPFDFSPPAATDESKTPLERYALGQLKLTAVLDGIAEPAAIVENAAGKGFTVKKGTKIGPNNGEVVEIRKDRLIIVETTTDFTGQTRSATVELVLRTKDQENR